MSEFDSIQQLVNFDVSAVLEEFVGDLYQLFLGTVSPVSRDFSDVFVGADFFFRPRREETDQRIRQKISCRPFPAEEHDNFQAIP